MASKSDFGIPGKRFPADSRRTIFIYLIVAAIYGSGLAAALWAGSITARAMHAAARGAEGGSAGVPTAQWSLAFVLIIAGMLSVIYAFFFRPRELRVSEEEVRYVMWDGSGVSMPRAQLEDFEEGPSRVVLRGGGKTVVVDRRFSPWKTLREEIVAWAGKKPA